MIRFFILRANANRNNDLQSAVFDGGRRTAPLSAPLYALCQSHIVALAAAAQPAKAQRVVLCNRGQYNPQGIKKIDKYELPSDEQLMLESINSIICETCYLNEQCSGSMCMRNKTEVQNSRNDMLAMLKAAKSSNNTGRE